MASERVEGHQVSEVNRDITALRAIAPSVQAAMSWQVRARPAADDAAILDSEAAVVIMVCGFISISTVRSAPVVDVLMAEACDT